MQMELVAPVVAPILALLFVLYLIGYVLSKPEGNKKMVRISRLIQEGAKAFLKREYKYISSFVAVLFLAFVVCGLVRPDLGLSWKTGMAFVIGAIASGSAGVIGMYIATRANVRTTQAAKEGGINKALDVAVSGGAVMGMSVVGIGLLGLVIVYRLFDGNPEIVNGYAFGASLVALFARSGGGIFTKGADMGADLVGKVESNIPEDDPRNPATIADNVGDNVGDVAGLGADLMESFIEAIIATLAIAYIVEYVGDISYVKMFPFMVASIGIISSIVGVMYVKLFAKNNPQSALMTGTYIAAGLTITGTIAYSGLSGQGFELAGITYSKWGPAISCIIGIVSGVVIGFVSEYYTSSKFKPVQSIAKGSQRGPAITVTNGTAVGMMSCFVPALVLAAAIVVSYNVSGTYGTAVAALGMLATTGMILAVDSYGPIADNAGGIAEMAELDPKIREITDNLDAVGNTTAAIGKGFAIGSAAFAAVGLLSAFVMVVEHNHGQALNLSLSNPIVLAGLVVGGMIPFFISSLLFKAVGKCADQMIEEVRRQFREIRGLKEGQEGVEPESAKCVDIATKGAIKGMLLPGAFAILAPILMGLSLGAEGLAAMLVGSIITGVMLGIQTANSGGAMDNAKKYIEEGHFGGKNSEAHKAAVVGDTVGDPLKDTVGPSINILIKLMCVIALVIAPLF